MNHQKKIPDIMTEDTYKTITEVSEGTYTEKRSKFIAIALPVRTLEEIKVHLEAYQKKYYDARHVCYAYMLGHERKNFRANDNGEPSGTAGKPILGQINSNELTDILIIVVRYFGGIKLGTSGLIVAYKAAAAEAIAACTIVEKTVDEEVTVLFEYPFMNDVMRIVKEHIEKEYVDIVNVFKECGVDIFVFETFPELGFIDKAIENAGENGFVITQFAINQFGYSSAGFSARKLIEEAEKNSYIDACGFNCGVGPGHMKKLVQSLINRNDKYFAVLPNAGYPQVVSGRMVFDDNNAAYFSQIMHDLAEDGADIIGGCCGTTPEYIRQMVLKTADVVHMKNASIEEEISEKKTANDVSFYKGKEGRKLIAVELAPPLGIDDEKIMDAAFLMKESGVDVLTFPDSPSGRTRADSILMAEKVSRETGMCVMPHICCRDKNAIAMRSQLLGAHINDINNFLVITGDPIPSVVRASVKSVFNFDSVGLMNIISDMNQEQFAGKPVIYGGAINQGRVNFKVELERVKKKMEAGATFFMTQPVFSDEDIDRLRQIKEQTGARILCGIMPFVSLRNATFMKNEMTGINVTDEILSRYRADMSKEEGEETGIQIAREIIAKTTDFVDGYYFSFPFNRVHMLKKIIGKNNQ